MCADGYDTFSEGEMQVKLSKWMGLTAAALALVALVGCGGTQDDGGTETGTGQTGAEELSGSLTVQGSDTMVNLAQGWAEAFQARQPGRDHLGHRRRLRHRHRLAHQRNRGLRERLA